MNSLHTEMLDERKDPNEQNLETILRVLNESKEILQKKELINKKNITEEMKAGDYTEDDPFPV